MEAKIDIYILQMSSKWAIFLTSMVLISSVILLLVITAEKPNAQTMHRSEVYLSEHIE